MYHYVPNSVVVMIDVVCFACAHQCIYNLCSLKSVGV